MEIFRKMKSQACPPRFQIQMLLHRKKWWLQKTERSTILHGVPAPKI